MGLDLGIDRIATISLRYCLCCDVGRLAQAVLHEEGDDVARIGLRLHRGVGPQPSDGGLRVVLGARTGGAASRIGWLLVLVTVGVLVTCGRGRNSR